MAKIDRAKAFAVPTETIFKIVPKFAREVRGVPMLPISHALASPSISPFLYLFNTSLFILKRVS